MADGVYPIEISEYYGLNTKESKALMPKGFCTAINNIDLSSPGIAKVRGGSETINDFTPSLGNGALELDGNGAYLSIPDDAAFDLGQVATGGIWSIECFVYVEDLTHNNVIFSQITDSSNYILGYIDVNGAIQFRIKASGSTVVTMSTAASAILEETAAHVVFVENGNNYAIYVDDTSAATATDADRPANYTGAFEIGRLNVAGSYDYFEGWIDEFRILTTTSSTTVPTAAYTSNANTALLLHFEGYDNSTTITDSSSNGHTVTANGNAKLHVGLMPFTPKRIWNYFKASAGTNKIMGNGGECVFTMENTGRWNVIATGSTIGETIDGITFGDVFYMGNGEDANLATDDGTDTRQMGITAPSFTPGVATGAAGALTGDYYYKVSYYNSTTGHESNGSTMSAVVSPSSEKVNLSGLTASSDSQVDKKRIYRTTAGGAIFFYLAEIANATTTYEDNIADSALGTTECPSHNDVPGPFVFWEEWDGRIWGVRKYSTKVEFSNDEYLTPAGTGLPEESFDPDNYLETQALIYGIKRAPGEVNQLWLHTSKGVMKVTKSYVPDDPYNEPTMLISGWFAVSHYSIQNVYNRQWFIAQDGKQMSCDPSGKMRYESYFIEPTLSSGNLAQFEKCQSVHYKNGTKNQYRLIYPESGETTPTAMLVANYLQLTPPDMGGDRHPCWESHDIEASCIGIVPDGDEKSILYTGHSSGAIKKQDTGTNDDGEAISWELTLGYMRVDKVPYTSYFPLFFIAFFNPLGNYSFSMRTNFDFGSTGGQTYQITTQVISDVLGVSFILGQSRLASSGMLQKISQRLGGDFNYISLSFTGQEVDEVMELNNIIMLFKRVEGERV